MSDVPTTTVAPTVTTTATEGTAAPAPTPTVTEAAPKTAADFLARVKSKANGNASVAPSPAAEPGAPAATAPAEPVVDATGRVHGPDGKFVPKPAGDEPAAFDTAVTTTAPAGGEPAPEVVKLALPEGHPLRDRGITELPFGVPKEHEELLRSLVNDPVRKQQVTQAFEVARQAERQALEAKAEAEFWRENAGSVFTPEFFQKYMDIKQTYGDADAELYKQAIIAKAQGQVDERRTEVSRDLAAREVITTAQQFRSLAIQDAQQRFPGWTPGEIDKALQAYGAWVHATGATQPTAEDWYRIADPIYASSPAGQQRRAAEAQRIATDAAARAQQEAAERERQALEQAANQRRANPLQGVPNVQTGLAVPGTNNGPKSAQDFIRGVHNRARGLA